MKTKLLLLLFSTFCLQTTFLFGQGGALNSSFGDNGVVVTPIGQFYDNITDIAILPDGGIIAAGNSGLSGVVDFSMVKYHADGSIDESFGEDGKVILDFFNEMDICASIVLQADGKIVLAGTAFIDEEINYALARFEADGSLDTSFGIDGKLIPDFFDDRGRGTCAILQADGKILFGGNKREMGSSSNQNILVIRYNPDWTLDTSFGVNGFAENEASSVTSAIGIQSNGKIVANNKFSNGIPNDATDFSVIRFNEDGTVDSTFATNGMAIVNVGIFDHADALWVQPDDKILIAGNATLEDSTATGGYSTNATILRFEADGQLDSTFATNGIFTSKLGFDVAVCPDITQQDDGKILASGRASSFAGTLEPGKLYVMRLLGNGDFDTTFGDNGAVFLAVDSIGSEEGTEGTVIDFHSSGLITVGGYVDVNNEQFDYLLTQFLSELNVGTLEFSKLKSEMTVFPNPVIENVNLKYTLSKKEKISIDLYSINGVHLKSFLSKQEKKEGTHFEKLHFGQTLPSGSYILTITNESEQVSFKIIK